MAAIGSQTNLRKNDRRVSCETLCSSNSSCVLQKRKALHPLATSIKSRTSNPVTQRVLSAKLLRFKALQNQLTDANYHITQLVNENKILKNLQRKQDHALSKYEGTNAHLPQILESHQEEIRVLHVKNKNLRKTLKDLSDQIKTKDEEINSLKDQNKHLMSLCKNKNLEERKDLQDKVEDLQTTLRQNENTISMLNRKLMLESKNYKFKLNSEVHKRKQTQRELHKVVTQLQEFSANSEVKLSESAHKRTPSKVRINSLADLINDKPSTIKSTPEKLTSSSLTNLTDDVHSSSSSVKSTTNLQEETSSISSKSPEEDDSEAQLKEIVHIWNRRNNKLEETIAEGMKKCHGELVEDAKINSNIVDKHREDYQTSLKDTEIILKNLKENDAKQERLSKLSKSGEQINFFDYSVLANKSSSDQLMKQLLKNEKYSFEEDLLTDATSKLEISEPEVDQMDRKKLLATLKAIDNGDNVLMTDMDMKKAKCDLMKELFGS